jgi:hypothetical protein
LQSLREQFEAVEADRAARLEVINEQGRRLDQLEAERKILYAELKSLRQKKLWGRIWRG